MSSFFNDFAWEHDDDVRLARAGLAACAYNAAVNHGSDRAQKTMNRLVEAINTRERVEGRVKLDFLVKVGIIEGYTPCPPECVVRPGGLFHAKDCENDFNHPVYKDRQQKAREALPGGRDGQAGWRAAQVVLVGTPQETLVFNGRPESK